MKTMKYFFHTAILSSVVLLTSCAGSTDPAETYKGESSQQIYRGGEEALRDKNYGEAIKRFEALDVQYPYDQNAEMAQLHIIYAYYMNSDYVATEAAADRFIHAHPTDPHVDYAYFMRGLANYYQNMGVFERVFTIDFATRDLSQLKKSFNDFSEIVKQFPDSHYAPAAHQYMIYLRNVLANHQLEVAQYYYSHQAYVAAVNRASLVVEYYQGAPAIPHALLMMAKSYHQLHQKQLENQTIQVLAYNFPHSKYLAEAKGDEAEESTVMEVPVQRLSPLPKPVAVKPPIAKKHFGQTGYQGNGLRGATPVPVGELFASSPKPKTVSKNNVVSAPNKKGVAAPQRQAAGATQQQAAEEDSQLYVAQGNGARGSKPMTLKKMLASDPHDSGFFTLHKKPVKQTPEEGAAPRATPVPAASGVVQPAQPAVNSQPPYTIGNGSR